MSNNNNIIRRLQDFSITNSLNSFAQNAIANNLLEFIFQESITDFNLEELALYCNASPATLSRFIRDLGYINYKEFKKTLLLYQNDHSEFAVNLDFSIATYQKKIVNNILETATLLESQDLTQLIELICNRKNIYFFGIHYSEMILKELQYNLLKIGKRVFWSEGFVHQMEALHNIEANSVCIFFSFSGNFIQSILPVLMQNKTEFSSFLVTSKHNEKYKAFFDEIIFLSHDAQKGSKTYQLQFFTDILFEYIKNKLLQ